MKIIKASNKTYICFHLEALPGFKLSVLLDNLAEASNLVDNLCKRGEIQNEQQFENFPVNFYTE